MNGKALHLLHTVPDARLLAAWVARHHAHHGWQSSDLGDAFHGLLCAAFGDAAPQPFRYLGEGQGLLAYTPLDADAVRAQVALADPLVTQTLGLGATDQHNGYQLRPFPMRWPEGHVLGFDVRVRPTVRTAKGERDVFLAAVEQANGSALQRQAIYAQWLRDHLTLGDGADRRDWKGAVELLEDVHLAGFRRTQVVRRTQRRDDEARRSHVVDGPDAVLKGHLRVVNPDAFASLLARGVGRHRAFGFGMLLLSRAA